MGNTNKAGIDKKYQNLADNERLLTGRIYSTHSYHSKAIVTIYNPHFIVKIKPNKLIVIIDPKIFQPSWLEYRPDSTTWPPGFKFKDQLFYFHRHWGKYFYPELYEFPDPPLTPKANCTVATVAVKGGLEITGSIIVNDNHYQFQVQLPLHYIGLKFLTNSYDNDNLWRIDGEDFLLIFRVSENQGYLESPRLTNGDSSWSGKYFSFEKAK